MKARPTQSAFSTDPATSAHIEAFIGRWETSGGAEMASFQTFANELCGLREVREPVSIR